MWFSPGIALGALIVLGVGHFTGSYTHWWLWLVAVVAAGILDALIGIERVVRPNFPTKTVYKFKDK